MDAEGAGNWCLIESDPGLFHELSLGIGVNGVQYHELLSLDPESFKDVAKAFETIYGFIFLFKWQQQVTSASRPCLDPPEDLFFAKQVITNSCSTHAILSVLLNSPGVALGDNLSKFKLFTKDFDPYMKGLALSNSEDIRQVHNSFKGQSTFELFQDDAEGNSEAAFHFVSYVPFDGAVWELDGLQEGPVKVGTYLDASSNEDMGATFEKSWLGIVRSELIRRIEMIQQRSCSEKETPEIRFNVLSVVKDRLLQAEEKVTALKRRRAAAKIQLMSWGEADVEFSEEDGGMVNDEVNNEMEDDLMNESDTTVEVARETIERLNEEINEFNEIIEIEKQKRALWKRENQLRKHDFIPFLMCALKCLAKNKTLKAAYDFCVKQLPSQSSNQRQQQ